jgi:hypothetical protein
MIEGPLDAAALSFCVPGLAIANDHAFVAFSQGLVFGRPQVCRGEDGEGPNYLAPLPPIPIPRHRSTPRYRPYRDTVRHRSALKFSSYRRRLRRWYRAHAPTHHLRSRFHAILHLGSHVNLVISSSDGAT